MRIGNRLFPYPVLNSNTELSEYPEDNSFGLCFDLGDAGVPIIDGDNLVLLNVCYRLECPPLENLVSSGLAAGAVIVECSASVFRKRYEISRDPTTITIPLTDLNGSVSVSCYLFATDEIMGFGGDGFLDDYSGTYFDIEKHDILAIDDGVSFKVEIDSTDDDRVASIFTVVRLERDDSNTISYESGEIGITIQLPRKYYDCYDNIKMHSDYNNISFAMIAVPVLTGCLFEIQNENHEDLDDIADGRRWFNSVRNSYARVTGNELDIEAFKMLNPYNLAQMVLNDASCRGLGNFNELLLGGGLNESGDVEGDNG